MKYYTCQFQCLSLPSLLVKTGNVLYFHIIYFKSSLIESLQNVTRPKLANSFCQRLLSTIVCAFFGGVVGVRVPLGNSYSTHLQVAHLVPRLSSLGRPLYLSRRSPFLLIYSDLPVKTQCNHFWSCSLLPAVWSCLKLLICEMAKPRTMRLPSNSLSETSASLTSWTNTHQVNP